MTISIIAIHALYLHSVGGLVSEYNVTRQLIKLSEVSVDACSAVDEENREKDSLIRLGKITLK